MREGEKDRKTNRDRETERQTETDRERATASAMHCWQAEELQQPVEQRHSLWVDQPEHLRQREINTHT